MARLANGGVNQHDVGGDRERIVWRVEEQVAMYVLSPNTWKSASAPVVPDSVCG